MDFNRFKRIVTSFIDKPANFDVTKKSILLEIRGNIIEIEVSQKEGEIEVYENGVSYTANRWIIDRLAQLPLLADRILEYIDKEEGKYFVTPRGVFLDDLEEKPDGLPTKENDIIQTITNSFSQWNGTYSKVFYLISDAGEGKTTIVNQLARQQARAYQKMQTDWLLIPFELGGRPFLRFDDIIVAVLMNKLKFPMLYYGAFIELVKLGVVIPAFDGFEEMFMESSTGEALSSLSSIVNNMESKGRILISARKAYFDYKSLASQFKTADTMKSNWVSASKLSIERWEKEQFIDYAA